MKGFGIEIKNNLLDPKHVDHMRSAIWLYLWLIDKITSINEEGIGLVLGGRPILYSEVYEELGMSERTYLRWVKILSAYPYIEIKRAPQGLIFRVFKAFKRFNKTSNSDMPKMAYHKDSDVPKVSSDMTKMAHPITYRQLTKTITKEMSLPDWLNADVWNEWVAYRKEIKKTLTPISIKRQLKLLEENKADHIEIIETSIRNGWTGLFPVKNKKPPKENRETEYWDEKKYLEKYNMHRKYVEALTNRRGSGFQKINP